MSSYVKDEAGKTYIAASQRPDGTWRKARRVKDGYVPQEEVPLYESKGKQFAKNIPEYPVGLSEEYVAERKSKREKIAKANAPARVPAAQSTTEEKGKGKSKKKKKKQQEENLSEDLAKVQITLPPGKAPLESSDTTEPDTASDPAKRLKNLRKKLREIESLEKKILTGELKTPDKDQLNKVARKNEVLKEINELSLLVDVM